MRSRNYRIDILRIVSAFFIVIIHVVSASVTYNDTAVNIHTIQELNIVHNLSNWAVPVFFMITGFCILGDDRECTWQWTIIHIRKYIGILFTVGWFYALLEYVYVEKAVSFQAVGLSLIDVLNGKTWTHMWFIYSIIGLYLVLPVVKPYIVQKERNVYYFAGLLFLSAILIPSVNSWLNLSVDIKIPVSGYLFYVVAGAVAARCHFENMKYVNLILIGANIIMVAYFLYYGRDEIYSYTSLPVCIMALSIFILGTKNGTGSNVQGRKQEKLAECTLGIYLIHPFFLNLMLKLLHIYPLHFVKWISIPITCIFLFFVSYVIVYGLKKIPVVRYFL